MTLSGLKLYFLEEETTALVLSWEGTQPLELRGPAGNEWNIFILWPSDSPCAGQGVEPEPPRLPLWRAQGRVCRDISHSIWWRSLSEQWSQLTGKTTSRPTFTLINAHTFLLLKFAETNDLSLLVSITESVLQVSAVCVDPVESVLPSWW